MGAKAKSNVPAGRPSKYDKIDLQKVEKLGRHGFTHEEIGEFIGISHTTLAAYKKQHPEFLEAIKKGAREADSKVIESLYTRAVGFEFTETHNGTETDSKGAVRVIEKTITKFMPPESTAIFFWLQNRRRQDWRDRRGEAAGSQGTVNIIFEKPE